MISLVVVSLILIRITTCTQTEVPQLFTKIGCDAEFSWNLDPIPKNGESVTIGGKLKGGNGYIFAFSDSGSEITPSTLYTGRIVSSGSAEKGIVKYTLKNTRNLDAGIYSATYEAGTFDGQELVLLDIPSTPIINVLQRAHINGNLVLNCSTNSNSIFMFGNSIKMNFEWKINGQALNISYRYLLYGSNLEIMNIQVEDAMMNITCRCYEWTNMTSEESLVYTIELQYGPDIVVLSSNVTSCLLKVGDSFPSISCVASCNALCSYTWYKRGLGKISESDMMPFKEVVLSDSGDYYCQATNQHGTKVSEYIHIEVYEINLERNYSCNINETVYFECKAASGSADTVYLPWMHRINGTFVRLLDGFSYSSLNVLYIRNCSYFHAGEYTCRTKISLDNPVITGESTMLNIFGPADIMSKAVKRSATQLCILIGYLSFPAPDMVKWMKDGTIITTEKKYIIETFEGTINQTEFSVSYFMGLYSRLCIHNFSISDNGVYRITLRNVYGKTEKKILLKEKNLGHTGDSESETLNSTRFLMISLVILLACGFVTAAVAFKCVRKRRKRLNQIALKKIRDRLAEINQNSKNEEDLYQSIDGESGSGSSTHNHENEQEYSRSSEENKESSSIYVVSDTQPENVELIQDSSYEDLVQVVNQPHYNTLEDGGEIPRIKTPITVSDVDSNLADDEISSGTTE